jgi:hypothetical protein
VGWKDENGETVKYKGTSAVKRVINPHVSKAVQKAEANEPECIPKILKDKQHSKKRNIPRTAGTN